MKAIFKAAYINCGNNMKTMIEFYSDLLGEPTMCERFGVEVSKEENPRFVSWQTNETNFGLLCENDEYMTQQSETYLEFFTENVDELFDDALEIILDTRKASLSLPSSHQEYPDLRVPQIPPPLSL